MAKQQDPETKCGVVAVMGPPNVGKSTLVNLFVGSKVTIVSQRVQTTRTLVRGIAMHNDCQIVFVDTPGIFAPKRRLERAMVQAAWRGRDDVDMILLVLDVGKKNPAQDLERILQKLAQTHDRPTPVVLVLNKVDLTKKESLLALSAKLNDKFPFAATFMVSAQKESGTKDLLSYIAGQMPAGEYIFDEDQACDMPARLLAAEITREKLFRKLHQEIPYALTVETENWDVFDNGSIKIEQTIYVTSEGHRKIILGKGGQFIKDVGEKSRLELQDIFQNTIHLKLFVKVRENWADDPERYLIWGLDPNE